MNNSMQASFDKEADMMAEHVTNRRRRAQEYETRIRKTAQALRDLKYSEAQINNIFSNHMTDELGDELVTAYDAAHSE